MCRTLNDLYNSQMSSRVFCHQHSHSYGCASKGSQKNPQCDHSPPTSQRCLQPIVEDALDEHWIAPASCVNSANSSYLLLYQDDIPLNDRKRPVDQTAAHGEVSRPNKKQLRGMSVCFSLTLFTYSNFCSSFHKTSERASPLLRLKSALAHRDCVAYDITRTSTQKKEVVRRLQ